MASKSTPKARSRKQPFKQDYSKRWECIVQSRRDECSARCTLCCSDFSIGHGGANDVQTHIQSKKHKSFVDSSAGTSSIAKFFQPKDYSVIRAETLMIQFLIEHNAPFSASDHLTVLFKKMFPDSLIASKFSSRPTKSTAIGRTLGQEAKCESNCLDLSSST